jgi:threonine/homoserine/homoserine lactone efflux protein
MTSAHTLLVFAGAALALLLLPGPSVLYITARSATQGRAAGLVSVLGVHTGTLVHVVAAAVGLSALLVASAVAFTAVRWAGAAYLIGLGIVTVVRRRPLLAAGDGAVTPRSLRRLYADGVVVNTLNPKTALFFLAFLPQFVDPAGAPVWAQTLGLGLLFLVIGLCSDGCYALAGARIGRWLRARPRLHRHTPLIEGGVLVGLGLVTLVASDARAD